MTLHFMETRGAELIAGDFDIVPIKPGTKHPGLPDWQNLRADQATFARWCADGKGVWGVGVLGERTPAVDLDISDEAILSEMVSWCDHNIGAAPRRIGRPPRLALVFRAETPFGKVMSRKFVAPDGATHQVEVIAKGGQFVAYAVHPSTGKPYAWPAGELTDFHRDMLPEITEAKARDAVAYFESIVPADWQPLQAVAGEAGEHKSGTNLKAPLDVVKAAVRAIPNNDLDYDSWIRVAHAIRGAVGDYLAEGCDLFHEWSSRSEKYDPDRTQTWWDGIKPGVRSGAGTLFYHAEQHGWQRPKADAVAEFGALDIDVGEPPASVLALAQRKLEEAQDRVGLDRRRRVLSYDDMAAMPEPEWLVEGVIQKRSAALLFGKSNTFKSFLAIDLACSVATARPWHGRASCAGRVLVVATEGANGVGRLRVPGWFNHYSVDMADRRNIHLLPAEISLDNPADVRWLIGAMSAIGPFALVVLDIFGGTMSGSDIEDTTARPWVRAVQRIIAETGAAVLTVAHTGWHDETRARMHTHFWGSFDSRLRIEGDKDKLTTCMHVERHKDADSTGSWGFSLVPSCGTLIPRFDADVRPMKNAKWTEPERKAFAALDEVLASAGAVQTGAQWPDCKVVAVAAWRQACDTAGLTSTDSADARRMAFNRAREKLEQRGDVKVQEDFVWSTFDAGAKGGKA